MKVWQILLLSAYSFGLAIGQLLFKRAAIEIKLHEVRGRDLSATILTNTPLWAAVALYAGLTGLWVYILTIIPLSRAYPAIALTFILTPLLGHKLFDEVLSLRFYCGLMIVIFGFALIVTEDLAK